jgi:hypothetical protein
VLHGAKSLGLAANPDLTADIEPTSSWSPWQPAFTDDRSSPASRA